MGIKERRRRQREELRGGILGAAREIASSEGWGAVTIRKIAAIIEYSPPVIYEYFGSKEEILKELTLLGYARQLEAVEAAAGSADDPEQALLLIGRAWMDFAFDSPDLYQVMYGLGGVSLPTSDLQREGERIGDAVGAVVTDILRDADKNTEDLEDKVTLLWATVHGIAALAMVGRIPGGKQKARTLAETTAKDFVAAWKVSCE